MAEKKMPHNETCESGEHKDHLCFLMYEGFHYTHPEEYKALVREADFRCQNCARTAKSETSLCAPVKL